VPDTSRADWQDAKAADDALDLPHPSVIDAEAWDHWATDPPHIIPEVVKLFSEPSIFQD